MQTRIEDKEKIEEDEKREAARQMKIESFILYDDEPGAISKEVQRLLLNFNIAELAMFFVS
jgi:hypothetical protein